MAQQVDELQPQTIAVIDLGGQYCHMIGRRLRDIGINAKIFDHDVNSAQLANYAGIILSGGPQSVYDPGSPKVDKRILDLGKPVLGICYGHQLLAQLLGSQVTRGSAEYGKSTMRIQNPNSLFHGTPNNQTVWMSHSDSVRQLPEGIEALAQTDDCDVAAFEDSDRSCSEFQFHPEVTHTEFGTAVLKNFSSICNIRNRDNTKDRVERLMSEIRTRVGNRSVFFFVSGGVDSTVAFVLCSRALQRNRVIGVYVDTGFMRKGETEELSSLLDTVGLADRLKIRPEAGRFLHALGEEIRPEEKRQIIGRAFIEVQQAAMREYGIDGDEWLLGQGTIYPDTIESGGANGNAAVIKTHHNRCEEVRALIEQGKVIEPLAEFYKDEVRQIGLELGLDQRVTERWPFPGPGLAIRCLGTDKDDRKVTPIKLPSRFRDYQAVQFPIRSVGVQGDGRTYREVVAIRGPLDYERLASLSTNLCNMGHNRVIVHVAGQIRDLRSGYLKKAHVSPERLNLLREADYVARTVMEAADLTCAVWQFPVVLVPVSFSGGETVVLRPVNSEDGMTANFARVALPTLTEMGEQIAALDGVDATFLDISDKPPATIEWE